MVAEASAALRRQNKLAPQNHHTLRNRCGRALPGLYAERTDYRLSTIDSEGEITFRPHHKPGHCAVSKWPGPVNALTVPLCQETWSVPENQHQGRHWLH